MPTQPKELTDAEVREEAARLGARTILEGPGRWAARMDDGRVEYGTTDVEALRKLVHAAWDADGNWRNQVDGDAASYLDLQD